jgi:hypothetical protein
MARFISMKNLRSLKAQADLMAAYAAGNTTLVVPLAQVVGQVLEVEEKKQPTNDGGIKKSLVAHGEFEAVNFETGETFRAASIYLPKYFAEIIERQLKASGSGVVFAAEIGVRYVGPEASIPFSYEVSPLVRDPHSPVEEMKRQLAKAGLLRLSAPAELPGTALPAPATAPAALPAPASVQGDDTDPGDEGISDAATLTEHGKRVAAKKVIKSLAT